MADVADPSFPPLKRNTIFVACSSDLKETRAVVEKALEDTIQEFTPNRDIRIFSWDLDLDPNAGLDARSSWQTQIPRPSDPKCLGTICLFAERIGVPLENDFKLAWIKGWTKWARSRAFKVKHPWPESVEKQTELLKKQRYPLTGTVFEFLDAFSSDAPLFVGFECDRPPDPNDPDVRLGDNRLLQAKTKTSAGESLQTWQEQVYRPQRHAVLNFAGALRESNRPMTLYQDSERLIAAIKSFTVREILKVKFPKDINPYKYLVHYDIDDGGFFRGRSDLVKKAMAELTETFDAETLQPFIGLKGRSGSGKSSLLRAGVLHSLLDPGQRSRFHAITVRPTDFLDEDNVPKEIVQTILSEVTKCSDLYLDGKVFGDFYDRREEERPGYAAEAIRNCLPPAEDGRPSKLVIGLDQLEEIIDDLSDEDRKAHWKPLTLFVRTALQTGRIGFVYTLESSRQEKAQASDLGPLIEKGRTIDVVAHVNFWRDIIEEPFRRAGYPLHREVIETLLKSIELLTRNLAAEQSDSLLPLVALSLSRIFDMVKRAKSGSNSGGNDEAHSGFDAARAPEQITLDDIPTEERDLRTAISREADAAWREVFPKHRTGSLNDDSMREDLGFFLRRLVRISDPALDTLALRTIGEWPYHRDSQLGHAFRRRRLLVPVGASQRLVHEALIRHWGPAKDWLQRARPLLLIERSFRDEAAEWDVQQRPARVLRPTPARVSSAAEILTTYLQSWSLAKDSQLTKREVQLREFCLVLLKNSKDPMEVVPSSPRGARHVHVAAAYGRVDILKRFYSKDPSCVNQGRLDKRTPLGQAAWSSRPAVEFLLSKGASPTRKDELGWRPIAAAVIQGNQEIFKLLLPLYKKKQWLLDGPGGVTLLHLCAQYNRIKMAGLLIHDREIDPNVANEQKWTPLHTAAYSGSLEAFNFILPFVNPAPRDAKRWTPLMLAVQEGQVSIVRSLIESDAMPAKSFHAYNDRGLQAIHIAAHFNQQQVLKILLDHVDPNALSRPPSKPESLPVESALHITARKDNHPLVRILLECEETDPGVVDGAGNTPLAVAGPPARDFTTRLIQRGERSARRGTTYATSSRTFRSLLRDERLDPGGRIEPNGPTPLLLAAGQSDWDLVERMLKRTRPQSLRIKSDDGKGLLHWAVKNDAPLAILDVFIQKLGKTQINALDKGGRTPVWLAAASADGETLDRLLAVPGANATIVGAGRSSALMRAVERQASLPFLERLAPEDASSFLHTGKNGWTPLHVACLTAQQDVIDWLIGNGAANCLKIRDRWDRRPYDLAPPKFRRSLEPKQKHPKVQTNKGSWSAGLEWKRLEGEPLAALLQQVDPIGDKYDCDDSTEAHTARLLFYPQDEARLIQLSSGNWPAKLKIYYIAIGEGEPALYWLNGTSPPIHEVNAKLPIRLTENNVVDYLRFFCFFVRGEEGPFLITESLSQPDLPAKLTRKERRSIADHLRPATLLGWDRKSKRFRVSADVYYSNALFFGDFAIQKGGMIEMVEDVSLVADLSAKVDEPVA